MENPNANLTITGFEAFHETKINASEQLIHCLNKEEFASCRLKLHTHVFPVVYQNIRERLEFILQETLPDIFLQIGVNANAHNLQLERVARNLDDSKTPDNRGVIRCNQRITKDSSTTYVSNLPLEEYAARLNAAGIPTSVSDNAGGFICNHHYYVARSIQESRGTPPVCLFVHVPKLSSTEPNRQKPDKQEMSIATATKGILMLTKFILPLISR